MPVSAPLHASDRLRSLRVPVSAVVCAKGIKLEQLLQWGPGVTLTFDKSCTSEVSLCIGTRRIAAGQAVTVGTKAGIRVVRLNPNTKLEPNPTPGSIAQMGTE